MVKLDEYLRDLEEIKHMLEGVSTESDVKEWIDAWRKKNKEASPEDNWDNCFPSVLYMEIRIDDQGHIRVEKNTMEAVADGYNDIIISLRVFH